MNPKFLSFLIIIGLAAGFTASAELWYPESCTGGECLFPVDSSWGLRIGTSTLANCDTIDTDASGTFKCGIDATGSGGESTWSTSTNLLYTTGDVLIGGSSTNTTSKLEVNGSTTLMGLTVSELAIGNYSFPIGTSTANYVMKLGADGILFWDDDNMGTGGEATNWVISSDLMYATNTISSVLIGGVATTTNSILEVTATTTFANGLTIGEFYDLNRGSWIDMPLTGPSGIGSGGVGNNAWIGYTSATGQWFALADIGDINYRNTAGSLNFGTASTSGGFELAMTIDSGSVIIGDDVTSTEYTFEVTGSSTLATTTISDLTITALNYASATAWDLSTGQWNASSSSLIVTELDPIFVASSSDYLRLVGGTVSGSTTFSGGITNGIYSFPIGTSTTGSILELQADGTLNWGADDTGVGGSGIDTWNIVGTDMFATDTVLSIGIGTTSANELFTIDALSSAKDIFGVYASSGVAALKILSSGEIKLGSSNPSLPIFVNSPLDVVSNGTPKGIRIQPTSDAAAAAIIYGFSPITGDYNDLRITVGGVGAVAGLYFATSGYIGVATDSPTELFTVATTSSNLFSVSDLTGVVSFGSYSFPYASGTAGQLLKDNGSGILYWADDTSGGAGGSTEWDWIVAGTDMYSTTTVTQVGIGTTTPEYTLDVWGDVAMGTGTEVMRIDENGRVGIATDTPSVLFTIATTSSNLFTVSETGVVGFGNYSFPYATGTTGQLLELQANGTMAWANDDTGASSGLDTWNITTDLMFATDTITSVLIGGTATTAPSSIFEVIGSSTLATATIDDLNVTGQMTYASATNWDLGYGWYNSSSSEVASSSNTWTLAGYWYTASATDMASSSVDWQTAFQWYGASNTEIASSSNTWTLAGYWYTASSTNMASSTVDWDTVFQWWGASNTEIASSSDSWTQAGNWFNASSNAYLQLIGGAVTGSTTFSQGIGIGSYSFPTATGSIGQLLKDDGTGALYWADDTSGGGGGSGENTWVISSDLMYATTGVTSVLIGDTATSGGLSAFEVNGSTTLATTTISDLTVTLLNYGSTTNWDLAYAYGLITNSSSTNWDLAYGTILASSSKWDLTEGWYTASSSEVASSSNTWSTAGYWWTASSSEFASSSDNWSNAGNWYAASNTTIASSSVDWDTAFSLFASSTNWDIAYGDVLASSSKWSWVYTDYIASSSAIAASNLAASNWTLTGTTLSATTTATIITMDSGIYTSTATLMVGTDTDPYAAGVIVERNDATGTMECVYWTKTGWASSTAESCE